MDIRLLSAACNLYQTSPEQLVSLSGGHYNEIYRFPLAPAMQDSTGQGMQYGVLRLGVEDCPPEQTLAMLDWVSFLSEHGAPVNAPVPSIRGQLLEQQEFEGKAYTITAFEAVEGTLAERIPPADWTDELFRMIGRAAGKFHQVSKQYHPQHPGTTRPQWFEGNEIQEACEQLAKRSNTAREKLGALLQQLQRLPKDPSNYGLIHDDLHFANFLIHEDGRVTIIDFDDCAFGWFSMDVAMALFDVLVLFNAPTDKESQEFARRFMHHYLLGYRQENEFLPFWQSQIPHFLKLKEICVYTPLIGHPDINLPDSWVGRFMRGRAERIANDVPYVEIDFISL
jgi:Ser/Thr protein kinase RdoA (MazF antagonist)